MKPTAMPIRLFALVAALAIPPASWSAEARDDAHASHHSAPQATTTATPAPASQDETTERMQTMRERMHEMRRTLDPAKRAKLMEAQMEDMHAMMQGMDKRTGAAQGGPRMMGPGMGMMMAGAKGGMGTMGQGMRCGHDGMDKIGGRGGAGMMGHGMGCGQGGMGMAGSDATSRRLETLEKRVDMMQMMMQMHLGGH